MGLIKACGSECFCHPFVRLPRISGKAKCDTSASFHHPSYLSQPSDGLRPELHRVERRRFIEAVVIKWQAFHRTVPEFHTTIFDGGRVPSTSLLDHLLGLINARDAPRPLRQALNNHARSEAHLQHRSFGVTSRRWVIQPPQSALVRAMMTPPNLPSIPWGRPNARIRMLRISLIDRSLLEHD
jgi:hypothetical protein